MKNGIASRLRQRLGLRWRRRAGHEHGQPLERNVSDEIGAEFTTEELREFLEGDLYPVEADPAFKEDLRQKLWDLVQSRYGDGD
jgi:hypothetical protein